MQRKNLILYLALFLGAFFAAFTISSLHDKHLQHEKETLREKLIDEAKAYFRSIVSTRSWNAHYKGVYIEKIDNIEPNEYLQENHFIHEDKTYIKVNPAWMTRMISEINNQKNHVKYKITSLNPLNPKNKPDSFEQEALSYLEKHTDEEFYYTFFDKNNTKSFKFIGKLSTERSCLQCHQINGYNEGDIRGGISINIPNNSYYESIENLEKHSKKYNWFVYIVIYLLAIVVAIVVHISQERKELNKKLTQQIQENELQTDIMLTQSRQAAMGDMVSMIAHQWRQPLSTISMDVNNVLADIEFKSLNDNELRENLESISKEVYVLSSTIEEFKEFFHPKNEKEHIHINIIMEELIRLTEKSLQYHNITLTKKVDATCLIHTYVQEFSQVLLHLIQNAKDALIKHRSDNRWIHITLDKKPNNEIIIAIEDNGGGIDENIVDKIFEPYFSTKEDKNDKGLGLYMVKTILNKHLHGTINVSNTKDGAKFIITMKIESCDE